MPGLTCDKKVVRNDIKLAAKIITNLDTKWGLWQKEKTDDTVGKFFLVSVVKKKTILEKILLKFDNLFFKKTHKV